MADEGVVDATVTEFKRHPFLIVGGIAAIVLIIYLFSGSGSNSAQPQNFTFSYGPSDAQVQAGTALAIAQGQQQTAVSLANTQAATQTAEASDYYGYLATNSANAVQIAGIQSQTALGTAAYSTQASIANTANTNATSQAIAQIQSNTAIQGYSYGYQTAVNNDQAQTSIAFLQTNAQINANNDAGQIDAQNNIALHGAA